jgi:ADP-ribosylglycohydrolase
VGVGIFFDPSKMPQGKIDRLGAEAVALTHGSPLAFLTGSMVAHIISRSLREPKLPLETLYSQALETLEQQYGHTYTHTYEICNLLRQAIHMASDPNLPPREAMERLRCVNAAHVLAGAVYATLVCREDFDSAMITAVNHSGRSAAVGALTGAILGGRLGEKALPEFYLDGLEPVDVLRELADDLFQGCPMEKGNRLFDGDWDHKYLHGGK